MLHFVIGGCSRTGEYKPQSRPHFFGWSHTPAQGSLVTPELLHDLEEDEAERELWIVPARLDATTAAL